MYFYRRSSNTKGPKSKIIDEEKKIIFKVNYLITI